MISSFITTRGKGVTGGTQKLAFSWYLPIYYSQVSRQHHHLKAPFMFVPTKQNAVHNVFL